MKHRRDMQDRRHERDAILAKIRAFSEVNPETGCWDWVRYLNDSGYGEVYWDGDNWTATRLVHTAIHGELSKELDICHSCDNRLCVNPDHLRADSHLNNQLEASAKKRLFGQWKTHCLRGHPLSGDNLRTDTKFRGCKICDRERQRMSWHTNPEKRERQKRYRAMKRAERRGTQA